MNMTMSKLWKLKMSTQRVLNVSADAILPIHTVYIVTVDDEPIATVKIEHRDDLEPAIKSQSELHLAHYLVGLHNEKIQARTKPTELTESPKQAKVVIPQPQSKRKGGWPKGKPRKPQSVVNGKEVQAKAVPSQSGGCATASPPQPNQGGEVQEGVQAQSFTPSGEGWYRG